MGLVQRIARPFLALIPKERVMRIRSGPSAGLKWTVGAGIHGCWLGTYERFKQEKLASLLGPGSTFIDIGAHAGYFTLLASRLVGPQGKVFSFEPSPRNREFLQNHLDLNRAQNVTVFAAAVAGEPGSLRFALSESGYMGHLDPDGEIEVPVLALDQLLEAGEIALPQVMKIDAEGAEADILRGGERLIRSARPSILLATHGDEAHRECCRTLREWGFRLSPLTGTDVATADEILATPERTPAGSP